MNGNYMVLAIFVMLFVAVLSGYKKGALVSLKWVVGMIVGILAAPVFSNVVIGILTRIGVTQAIGAFATIGGISFLDKIMQIIAFCLIMYLSKCIINICLPASPRHGVAKAVDGALGACIGILQVCIVIWIISYLAGISPVTLPFALQQSKLYAYIAEHNMLHFLYHLASGVFSSYSVQNII